MVSCKSALVMPQAYLTSYQLIIIIFAKNDFGFQELLLIFRTVIIYKGEDAGTPHHIPYSLDVPLMSRLQFAASPLCLRNQRITGQFSNGARPLFYSSSASLIPDRKQQQNYPCTKYLTLSSVNVLKCTSVSVSSWIFFVWRVAHDLY